MDRLFLDANVLFSAAYKADARVSRLWKLSDVVLCSSRYALEEARANLEEEEQRQRLEQLAKTIHFLDDFTRSLPGGVSIADKDIPILMAAVHARADYLLTGDIRHFGRYFGKKIEGVTIILPGKYLKLRKGES